jgi:hypothetical protein
MNKLNNPHCLLFSDKREKIVLKDDKNPQKFIAENFNKYHINAYKIDNCILTNGNKCDFLLEIKSKSNIKAYFIELKGQDLKHAILQLEESIKSLNYCNGIELQARVILNKVKVPAIRTSYEIRFEKMLKKCNKSSKYDRYKSKQKIENI